MTRTHPTYDPVLDGSPEDDEFEPRMVCRHDDVVAAAHDPITYSSAVSRFLQIPNGLDGDAHRAARDLLDPFFAPDRMDTLEPLLVTIAEDLAQSLPPDLALDAVQDIGARFAVRAQSTWLGWPTSIEQELLDWMDDNHRATRSGDLARTTRAAEQFDLIIQRLVVERRAPDPSNDVTTELVQLRDGNGRPLADEVLVSVLRNWTGGDLGSMALATGVIVHWLALHPDHQEHLRSATSSELVAAIDEILRLDDPFVSNRRVATRETTTISGCPVHAGQEVILNWTAANLDPEAFEQPDRFDPGAHAAKNLVYGTGPHACPGRPLASLELRIITRALLEVGRVLPALEPPQREQHPLGGFSRVPIRINPR
jgi:cytochrome P450